MNNKKINPKLKEQEKKKKINKKINPKLKEQEKKKKINKKINPKLKEQEKKKKINAKLKEQERKTKIKNKIKELIQEKKLTTNKIKKNKLTERINKLKNNIKKITIKKKYGGTNFDLLKATHDLAVRNMNSIEFRHISVFINTMCDYINRNREHHHTEKIEINDNIDIIGKCSDGREGSKLFIFKINGTIHGEKNELIHISCFENAPVHITFVPSKYSSTKKLYIYNTQNPRIDFMFNDLLEFAKNVYSCLFKDTTSYNHKWDDFRHFNHDWNEIIINEPGSFIVFKSRMELLIESLEFCRELPRISINDIRTNITISDRRDIFFRSRSRTDREDSTSPHLLSTTRPLTPVHRPITPPISSRLGITPPNSRPITPDLRESLSKSKSELPDKYLSDDLRKSLPNIRLASILEHGSEITPPHQTKSLPKKLTLKLKEPEKPLELQTKRKRELEQAKEPPSRSIKSRLDLSKKK